MQFKQVCRKSFGLCYVKSPLLCNQGQVQGYLQVVLGVPVRIEDDAGVGGRQVDAQTSGSGAEQEDESVRVGFAEAVDGGLPQVPSHAAVDALVRVPGNVLVSAYRV